MVETRESILFILSFEISQYAEKGMASGTIQNTNGFLIKQRLGASDDLNDLVGYQYVGFYYATENVANAPENWVLILSIASSADAMFQFCFKGSLIYTRVYGGNPRTWTSWVKFTGTVVS